MKVDLSKFRKAGVPDERIAEYLSKKFPDLKIQKAVEAGFSLDEIASRINEKPISNIAIVENLAGKVNKAVEKGSEWAIKKAEEVFPVMALAGYISRNVAPVRKGLEYAGKGLQAIQNVPFATVAEATSLGKDVPFGQTSGYLQKMGVPPELSKTLSLPVDVATGLLTGGLLSKAGYKAFKYPFSKADKALRLGNNPEISDILFTEGFAGDTTKLLKRNVVPEGKTKFGKAFEGKFDVKTEPGLFSEYLGKYKKQSKQILKEVKEASDPKVINKNYDINVGEVTKNSESIKKLISDAETLSKENPEFAWMAQDVKDTVARMSEKGYMSVEEVADLKSTWQKLAKKFKTGSEALTGTKPNEFVEGVYKRASGAVNDAIKESISKYDPELAQKYIRLMNKSGAVQESYKGMYNAAITEGGKMSVSPFGVASAQVYPQLLLAQKAFDVMKNTAFPTRTGRALYGAGNILSNIGRTAPIVQPLLGKDK
jgi:hypothetical protein